MNKQKTTKKFVLLLAIFLYAAVMTACDTKVTPIIPETTKPMDEATLDGLVSVTGNGSMLTFDGITSQLEAIAENDIVVAGVSDQTPNGLLRKVTGVYQDGNKVTLETAQVTLEEAIQQGEMNVNVNLDASSLKSVHALCRGVTIMPMGGQLEDSFEINMDDVILYDDDGDEETSDDQVKASGGISFTPGFEFDVEISWFSLKKLVFNTTTDESTEIKVASSIDLWSMEAEKELASYSFTPITVFIGTVPVVITPELTVSVGAEGSVSFSMSTNVTQEATLTAGLEYNAGMWKPIADFTNTFGFNPPNVDGEVLLKGYAGPELELKLYGTAGPSIEINGYLNLEAEFDNLELYGGLSADVGVSVEVLSRIVAEYEANVITYNKLLYSLPDDNQTTTTTTVATDTTTTTVATDTTTTTSIFIGDPPTIHSIIFPSEITADGANNSGTVKFSDPDGDIVRVYFDLVSGYGFSDSDFDPMGDLKEGDVYDGTFGFSIWCDGSTRYMEIELTLEDQPGNMSNSETFGFTCTEEE
jgi:hypothetical protein